MSRCTSIVRKGDGEAVFNPEGGVELRESAGFKLQELRRAQGARQWQPRKARVVTRTNEN